MNQKMTIEKIDALAREILSVSPHLSFTIFEIGAVPLKKQDEPFYHVPDIFPGSRIVAFEIDEKLCKELNGKARTGLGYFPVALGKAEEERTFYNTIHPMCGSLYKPNENLLRCYNNLDVALLKSTMPVATVSLDYFCKENGVTDIDFIKIDVQGAELDIFKGGTNALQNVIAIVSEVEFIPLYKEQPLFGDVCTFLSKYKMMFHKFLALAGRSLKPVVLNNNPNLMSQQMWADAIFIRDILELPSLDPDKLLKLGFIAYLYGSIDVAFYCLRIYDEKMHTNIQRCVLD